MQCMVCNSQMNHYFSKKFDVTYLSNVEYEKCINCGFVMSKTHYELSNNHWCKINKNYHQSYQGKDFLSDDPRWIKRLRKQAEVINDGMNIGLIPKNLPWIDYGCGDGKLPDLLQSKYGIHLKKFDKFMHNEDFTSEEYMKKNKFDFVITTSVFEHVLHRQALDDINSLVSDSGVMALHTLVADEIPDSPDWFYLLPVHCSFFTNKSMQILFKQWGYKSSIYHVDSQLWLFFKSDPDRIENVIANANKTPGRKKFYYHFKRDFMDYWKLNKSEVLARKKTIDRRV